MVGNLISPFENHNRHQRNLPDISKKGVQELQTIEYNTNVLSPSDLASFATTSNKGQQKRMLRIKGLEGKSFARERFNEDADQEAN